MSDANQSHPAPTPDLLLTDEELWMLFYQDGTDPTKEGSDVTDWIKKYDGAACKRIAQAQLSKLQQARPTAEQTREALRSLLIHSFFDARNFPNNQEINLTESADKILDQILRLLPFPDEQGIRESERKAIGEWLKGLEAQNLPISDFIVELNKYIESLKMGEAK